MFGDSVITEMFQIAADLEPEYSGWTYGVHDWCIKASEDISLFLNETGVKTKPVKVNYFGPKKLFHAWAETNQGVIIDATVKQFFLPDKNICRHEKCPVTCSPILKKKHFSNHSFWILNKNHPYRKFYIYR